MAMQENFFVVPFKNPNLDDSMHYMVFHPPENKVVEFLNIFRAGHRHIQIDFGKKFAAYPTKQEAEDECKRLGEIANQINPDRIDAATMNPPNLALEPGKIA